MRAKRYLLLALCAWMAVAGGVSAQEATKPAEDPGLSDVLTDLLNGGKNGTATPGPDRRVPFGREEMQLAFAPLV